MSVTFVRVESAFAACRDHLDATDTFNSEVESFLVSYLLIAIRAEFEQHVTSLLRRRTAVDTDDHLTAWGAYSVGRLARKITVGDLSGLLAAFSQTCKDRFSDSVTNTVHHLAYDSIVNNRQLVAHAAGGGMTLGELETAFRDACQILEQFEGALLVGRPSQP